MKNKHYKKTLKNGGPLESIDYIQGIMGDKFQYGCWFNILKYPIRCYDKHKTPIDDIKKTMHYSLFLLNDLNGNNATKNQEDLFKLFEKLDNKEYEINIENFVEDLNNATILEDLTTPNKNLSKN